MEEEKLHVLIRASFPGFAKFTKHQEHFEHFLFDTFPRNRLICFTYYTSGGGWGPEQYVEYEIEIPIIKNDEISTKHLIEKAVKLLRGENSFISYY